MVAPLYNGNGKLNGHTNGHRRNEGSNLPYKVNEQPFETRRPIKVVCIGSGFSGIYLALRLQQRCQNVELVIYEKNEEWNMVREQIVSPATATLHNQRKLADRAYNSPGVACDVPAHIYCYSFEPDTNWSEHYASGGEILSYLKRCADKFKARQFIKFNHKVTSAVWNDDTGKWDFIIDNDGTLVQDSAEVFINAGGFLNAWKWPDIEGLDSFKGKLLHTAAWEEGFDYKGKSVAVIGSGSSALQVIPNLQPHVKHMDAYIRSATYIPEPLAFDFLEREHCQDYKGDRKYSEADKRKFAEDPEYLLQYRKFIESGMNEAFQGFHAGTEVNKAIREAALLNMKKCLANKPEIMEWMAPTWDFGCRRPSPGIGFLEALTSDNVDTIRTEIQSITPKGIRTVDGEEREVDAIVCATGFDVSWRPRFTMRGRDGFELDTTWASEPRSYFSIAIENMPNYFIFNGPYNCGGNGNAVPPIEVEGDYMIQCINKIQRQGIRSMTVQTEAVEEFQEHADAFQPRMTWAGGCRNWYRTKTGRVVGTFPGSGLMFNQLLQNPRWEDYDYEYIERPDSKRNRFTFLGNGLTVEMAAGKADLSPYLNKPVPATLP